MGNISYQSHSVHLLSNMLRVCVVGHSLVPTAIPLNSSSVQLEIIRYPGVTIASLTDKLTNINFWTRRYDGIILCIGGNDLARLSVDEVFSRLCDLARRLRTQLHSLLFVQLNIDYILDKIDLGLIKRRIDVK